MEKYVNVFALSHIGNSRDNQEDSFLIHQEGNLPSDVRDEMRCSRVPYSIFCLCGKTNFMVAVSDGMGGHASGEIASGQTVKYLSDNYQRIIDGAYLNEQFLVNEINTLNRYVVSYSKTDPHLSGMGATLCGVVCSKGICYGINVGDSRIYRYCNDQLDQLTTDHTEGQRLLKLNLLTEDEYDRFPHKKNLYKHIGYNGELIADIFKIASCFQGTTLLLCSDGLTDVVSDAEIALILRKNETIEQKGKMLVDQALGRNVGRGDNITLVLIEF